MSEPENLPPPPAPPPETLSRVEASEKDPAERFKSEVEAPDEMESGVPDFTLEDVGHFAYERQAIWHRRFVLERPEPWTDDEVLRDWRICNIYRELDKGTQFMLAHVVERDADRQAKLMNAVVYRLLNRSDSWEKHVGWLEPPYAEAVKAAGERLATASADGEVIRTNAFRAGALAELIKASVLVADGLDELHALCSASNSLKMVHAVLSRGYEIGDFTAYQVALDLKFIYPNLDNDDWVFVYGRGTRRKDGHGGSMWALRKLGPTDAPISVARHLRDTQDEWLPPEWSEVAWPPRPRLALVDIDNLMCEFRKYWLKRHGQGSLRRYGDAPEPTRRRRPGSALCVGVEVAEA